jgi:hypothetical protein
MASNPRNMVSAFEGGTVIPPMPFLKKIAFYVVSIRRGKDRIKKKK